MSKKIEQSEAGRKAEDWLVERGQMDKAMRDRVRDGQPVNGSQMIVDQGKIAWFDGVRWHVFPEPEEVERPVVERPTESRNGY